MKAPDDDGFFIQEYQKVLSLQILKKRTLLTNTFLPSIIVPAGNYLCRMDNGFVWAMTPQQLAGSLYNVIHAEDDYLFIHVVILRWNILKNIAIFLDRFGTRNIVMVGCPGEAFLYYPASGATCWVSDRSNNDFKTLHNNGLEENIFQMTEIPSSFPHRTLR